MIGQTILHYRILAKLGEGGMGEVYLAEDSKLERKVALKFLPAHYIENTEINARFRREAKAAAALNHPNIITVYDIGEHEGRAYIAMEYVEGQSLREAIVGGTSRSPLQMPQIVDILSQVCAGLAKAHQAGIVHRDLKPENIMLDTDGTVKILDFGLAQMQGKTRLTIGRSTLGTLHYMSPEQFEGMDTDHRADIWAVGVMLYEMVTSRLPFEGEYEHAIIYSINNQEPAPLISHKTGVSPDLQRIVDKALDKDRETRYQDITELLADLKRVSKSESVTAKRMSGRQKSKLKRLALRYVAMTAVVVIAGVAGIFLLDRQQPLKSIPVTQEQVTFSGKARYPEISPDGQFMAYYVPGVDSVGSKIWVQDLSGGQPIPVFSAIKTLNYFHWMPDGSELIIDASTLAGPVQKVIVPRLGGVPRAIKSIRALRSLSPDGQHIAGAYGKAIAFTNMTTGEFSTIQLPRSFTRIESIDWSPRGDHIAIKTKNDQVNAIWTTHINGSGQHKVIEEGLAIRDMRWSATGDAIYFQLNKPQSEELLKIEIDTETGEAKGQPQVLATSLQLGIGFSLSSDNKRMVYGRGPRTAHLWLMDLESQTEVQSPQAEQITTGTAYHGSLAISPDGKQIAVAVGYGVSNIFLMPLKGGAMKQLTFLNSNNINPCWSPDGKEIAFKSNENGETRIWRISVNGGTPRPYERTKSHLDLGGLNWSPGTRIMYQLESKQNFHFIDPETEAESPLLHGPLKGGAYAARYSPDGKKVALRWTGDPLGRKGLWVLSLEDSTKTFLKTGFDEHVTPMTWSQDGKWIFVYDLRAFPHPVFKVPANGGEPQFLTSLPHNGHIIGMDMTPDGKYLVYAARVYLTDVWMLESFDPESELETPFRLQEWPEGEILTLHEKGSTLIREKKYAEAEAVFRRGLAMRPEHSGFLDGMRQVAFASKNYAEAKRYGEKMLSLDIASSLKCTAHADLAVIGLLSRDYRYSEAHFRNAFAIDSTNSQALRGLGYLFFEQNRFAEAEKYAQQALALDSSYANYNLTAWVLVAGEIDLDRGMAFAEKALASQPETWQQTIETYPYLAFPEHTLGLAYLKKGEYEKAAQYLEQAAKFAPERQAIRDDLQHAKEMLQEMPNE